MTNMLKFGRKMPVPSTIEIKHELRLRAATEDLVAAGFWDEPQSCPTDAARRERAGDLSRKHGISVDRAEMLVDRFVASHHIQDIAARSLGAP